MEPGSDRTWHTRCQCGVCKVGSNLNLTCSDWSISRLLFRLPVWLTPSMQCEDLKYNILYLSDKNVQKIFYLCGLRHFLLKEVLGIIGVLTLTMKHMLVGSHSLSHSFSHLYSQNQHNIQISISQQNNLTSHHQYPLSVNFLKRPSPTPLYFLNDEMRLVSPWAPPQT